MPKFNNKVCFENMIDGYKAKGLKTGEFEKEIGASVGHFSRLSREDGKLGSISAELLFNASDVLGIPVEILGSVNLKELDSTEKYLYEFICKLINETNAKKIDWNFCKFNNLKQDNYLSVFIKKEYDDFTGQDYYTYDSDFWDSDTYNYSLIDNVLYFYQKNGYFVLNKVNVSKKLTDVSFVCYELYFRSFHEKVKTKIICSSPEQKGELNSTLEILYKSILNYLRQPKVNDILKNAIDSFMDDETIFDEDLF